MGWTAIKNGELLALASKQFDVFVTVDRNLSFQQNLYHRFAFASSCFGRNRIALPISGGLRPW